MAIKSNRFRFIAGVVFIVILALLMILPIGRVKINNVIVIGLRVDYLIHTLIYLPWMFVGNMVFGKNTRPVLWLMAGFITVVLLEYIQKLLPYRGFNVNDIIAGEIGVALSYLVNIIRVKINKKYINE